MKAIIITGAQIKGFKMNNNGDKGYIKIIIPYYENRKQSFMWATALIEGELLARWKELNPGENAGINIYGDFNTFLRQHEGHPATAELAITAKQFEIAKAYGSGICNIMISRCRIIREPIENENSTFLLGAYDNAVKRPDGSADGGIIRLACLGNTQGLAKTMRIKKGSLIDVMAKYSHNVNMKDGTSYLNVNGTVIGMSYAATEKNMQHMPPTITQPQEQQTAVPDQTCQNNQAQAFATQQAYSSGVQWSMDGVPENNLI